MHLISVQVHWMRKEKTKIGFDNWKWWITLWWSNFSDRVYSNAWHLFGLHSWPWLVPKPSLTYARLAELRIFYRLSHFLAHLKWSAYIWEVHFPWDRWKFRQNFKGLTLSDIFMLFSSSCFSNTFTTLCSFSFPVWWLPSTQNLEWWSLSTQYLEQVMSTQIQSNF